MEVYGLPVCEIHGGEATAGALEEMAYDLEQELQRPMNPHVRRLSPHLARALRHGGGSLPSAEAHDHRRAEAALLAAFPLRRELAEADTLAYVEAPDHRLPPYETFMLDRQLSCRFRRLAFEEEAVWLVEMLERERASVAAQAAYALALDREAGLR